MQPDFVMGHKNADLDAVGAAVGICCLCRKKGEEGQNRPGSGTERGGKAPGAADGHAGVCRCLPLRSGCAAPGRRQEPLIVVDTNRPDQVECKPLLDAISKVCVVDHHRRAADYINPVVVNLHEPYASSASELVTELLQYAVEGRKFCPWRPGRCWRALSWTPRTSTSAQESAPLRRPPSSAGWEPTRWR